MSLVIQASALRGLRNISIRRALILLNMKRLLPLLLLFNSLASAQFEGKPICFTVALASDASGFENGGALMDYSSDYLRARGVKVLAETFDACQKSRAVPLALLLGHPPTTPEQGLVVIAGETYESGGKVPAAKAKQGFDDLLDKLADIWLSQN